MVEEKQKNFGEFIDAINVAEDILFVREESAIRSWCISGTMVVSSIGTYNGEEAMNFPSAFKIPSTKMKELYKYINKDMAHYMEDNSLIVESKNRKFSFRLKDIEESEKRIPNPQADYGKALFHLSNDSIDYILDQARFQDSSIVQISVTDKEAEILVKGAVPGNGGVEKVDLLRQIDEPYKIMLPKDFYMLLNKIRDGGLDIYLTHGEKTPIKMVSKNNIYSVQYYLAPRLGEPLKDIKKAEKTKKVKE